jgi:hypothetical protein
VNSGKVTVKKSSSGCLLFATFIRMTALLQLEAIEWQVTVQSEGFAEQPP